MGILTQSGKTKLTSFRDKLLALKEKYETHSFPIPWSTGDSKTDLDYNFLTEQKYL